jgi:molecular chaperone GrpE
MVKKTKKTDQIISTQEAEAKAMAQYHEMEERYKRVLADFQNQERRHREQESQIIKMSNAALIEKLLFVVDSLQLAQSHLQDKGITMIVDQFTKILESEGLEKIITKDKPFDPLLMDCSEMVAGEKDLCIETISEGYFLNGKVLRPAKVRVGNGESVQTSN